MVKPVHDRVLDDLLALDGVVLVVDPLGTHWVKFVAKRVDPSDERPHGVSYSLTLHAANGERLVALTTLTPSAAAAARRDAPAQHTIIGTGMARPSRTNIATRRR
jgi:hypothetical protein